MIWPEAFDFTSTTLIGSSVPVASTVSTMSRRSAFSVGTTVCVASFFAQAIARKASAGAKVRMIRLRLTNPPIARTRTAWLFN